MTLAAIVVLASVTFLFRAAASVAPALPASMSRRTSGLAPALLAALVVTQLVNGRGYPSFDAKAAGVTAALVAAALRLPALVCVIAGAAVAAALRAVGWLS